MSTDICAFVQLDAWLGEGKCPYFNDSDSLIRWLDHCSPQHSYPPDVEALRGACLSGTHPVAQDFFLAKVKSQMTLPKIKERLTLISGILDICFDHLSGAPQCPEWAGNPFSWSVLVHGNL